MKKICKKKLLLLLVLIISVISVAVPVVSFAIGYQIPNDSFKDEFFYKCLIDSYNKEHSTEITYETSLTDAQLNDITTVTCSSKNIKDVSGIEKLINLEHLYLYDNMLSSINLNNNRKLKTLYMPYNNIKNIDVSSLTNLEILDLSFNGVVKLDVSNNSKLFTLSLTNNAIQDINLNKNVELLDLDMEYNRLRSIDLTKNTKLKKLVVSQNFLTSIDLSKNVELETIYLSYNYLNNIDLSKNTKLTTLNISDNDLVSIDVSNNSALEHLDFSYNMLETINIGNLESLNTILSDDKFYIKKMTLNNITMDLTNTTDILYLEDFYIIKDKKTVGQLISSTGYEFTVYTKEGEEAALDKIIENGDVIKLQSATGSSTIPFKVHGYNTYFEDESMYSCVIDAYNSEQKASMKITDMLSLEQLATIENLNCSSYKDITSAKGIEYLTGLKILNLSKQFLSEIDLTKNVALSELNISENLLKHIDLSKNSNLELLNVSNNRLMSLDLTNNKKLVSVITEVNFLNDLKLPETDTIVELSVWYNSLKSLDTSKLSNLKYLDIEDNIMEKVKINNPALETLYTEYISSKSIDLSKALNINTLWYEYNQIFIYNPNTIVDSLLYSKNENIGVYYLDKKLESNSVLKTGYILRDIYERNIDSNNPIYSYYDAVFAVKGDVAAQDGQVKINDVSKIYNTLKSKVSLTDLEFAAADVDGNGSIRINDVSKVYNYLKGKINTL